MGVGRATHDHDHARLEDLLFEALEQPAHDHGLARAGLPHQHAEALGLSRAAVEPAPGVVVRRALEEEPQVGLVSKRITAELEVMEVLHGSSHE